MKGKIAARTILALLLISVLTFNVRLWFPWVSADESAVRSNIVDNASTAAAQGWHYLSGAEGELPCDGTGVPKINPPTRPNGGSEVQLYDTNPPEAFDVDFSTDCQYWENIQHVDCTNIRHADCSGLVYWAYTNWNNLPDLNNPISVGDMAGLTRTADGRLTADAYFKICKQYNDAWNDLSGAEDGDLLFIVDASGTATHVGIVVDSVTQHVVHASGSRWMVVNDPLYKHWILELAGRPSVSVE